MYIIRFFYLTNNWEIIQDLSLSDELVDFLRGQLAYSDLSNLRGFVLQDVDFSSTNSLTLHKLIAPFARYIEHFEVGYVDCCKFETNLLVMENIEIFLWSASGSAVTRVGHEVISDSHNGVDLDRSLLWNASGQRHRCASASNGSKARAQRVHRRREIRNGARSCASCGRRISAAFLVESQVSVVCTWPMCCYDEGCLRLHAGKCCWHYMRLTTVRLASDWLWI